MRAGIVFPLLFVPLGASFILPVCFWACLKGPFSNICFLCLPIKKKKLVFYVIILLLLMSIILTYNCITWKNKLNIVLLPLSFVRDCYQVKFFR